METGESSDKVKDQKAKLNTPSRGKPGKIVDSELAMELFFNLVFALPIVIYRGFKFIVKKLRKTGIH